MLQRLFGLLFMALFGWLLSRLMRGAVAPPGRSGVRGRQGGAPRIDGRMVRDRVCNTYLPEASALTEQVGDETLYFCSERCRSRFLAGERAAGQA